MNNKTNIPNEIITDKIYFIRGEKIMLDSDLAALFPMPFTEQGVAMLSSVLKSKTAIKVNIQIIRIFTQMRNLLSYHKEILLKPKEIEGRVSSHDEQMLLIF